MVLRPNILSVAVIEFQAEKVEAEFAIQCASDRWTRFILQEGELAVLSPVPV